LSAELVDARQEIDLRLGAAFTRFQTQRLSNKYQKLANGIFALSNAIGQNIIPCQF
jgi:hypothetical protein